MYTSNFKENHISKFLFLQIMQDLDYFNIGIMRILEFNSPSFTKNSPRYLKMIIQLSDNEDNNYIRIKRDLEFNSPSFTKNSPRYPKTKILVYEK